MLDTLNAAATEIGSPILSDEQFFEVVNQSDNVARPFTMALLQAMEAYATEKWEQACNEMWVAVNEAMGDLSVEDSMTICGVKHPEFKP